MEADAQPNHLCEYYTLVHYGSGVYRMMWTMADSLRRIMGVVGE